MDEPILARGVRPRTDTQLPLEQLETRECRSCCGEGTVVEDATYDVRSGELVQVMITCPTCQGEGSVSVYLYASPLRRRR